MKNKFKKIMSVVGSVLMVGSTVGFAMAAGGGFPTPFVEDNTPNYALVVGASAAATDMTGANSINDYLNTFYTESDVSNPLIGGDFSDSVGIREEVELGNLIVPTIRSVLLDNKIPTLLDGEFNWNNGVDSDTYDIHEEIIIGDMIIQTTLDDMDLDSDVVLENDKALEYRYVFDDTLDTSLVGHVDADPLYLILLGKEYEVLRMDGTSISVSFSDEKVVKTGDSVSSDGVTLLVGDIFLGSVEVGGVLIKEGRTRTVNGIEVFIDTIAYHSSSTLPSKAIIKVGRDISQTINNGDEYVEGDESWLWSIENLGTVGGYIGVRYDINSVGFDEDEPETNAISVGGQYGLPENYGAVVFEGLTDVNYEDFELSFDDRDLYSGIGSEKIDDANVVILEGENDDSISFTLDGTLIETDSIYFRYVKAEGEGETFVEEYVKLYFKDLDGDIDNDHEGRIQLVDVDNSVGYGASEIKLVVGDTEIDITFNVSGLTLTNEGEVITIPFGEELNEFKYLGTIEEDAEPSDVSVGDKGVGMREEDVFTHYGLFVRNPESNADSDRVILSVPSEQVFAKVSALGQGVTTAISDGNETVVEEVGGIVIKDNEAAAHGSKNLIIVGGSCINTEAARLLGGHACGSDFTLKTGVTAGQYIIQTFDDAGRIAVVVAGYEAADTTRGVADFIASETDFSVVGSKLIA